MTKDDFKIAWRSLCAVTRNAARHAWTGMTNPPSAMWYLAKAIALPTLALAGAMKTMEGIEANNMGMVVVGEMLGLASSVAAYKYRKWIMSNLQKGVSLSLR